MQRRFTAVISRQKAAGGRSHDRAQHILSQQTINMTDILIYFMII